VSRLPTPIVQVIGLSDNWILERLARRPAGKLPYATFIAQPTKDKVVRLAYYVNYFLYNNPSGLIDVRFFTHCEREEEFLGRARHMHFCVSQSKLYTDWLISQGVRTVIHIRMGYGYRPQLVLGVIGLLEHPRKGRHLVDELCRLPFVEIVTTKGKVAEADLPGVYQRVDYVLIPATIEGGPMSLLDGLAMGKPVIAPQGVGMLPEFFDTEHVRG
jgi:glycosyltransferase involved in cell wall biosynthesis